ncbi:MAG: hypothetical protein HRU20_27925 [Pseudomonadales bacterium]|nr:hypothetical protein [Pseudomonadales bacterium]
MAETKQTFFQQLYLEHLEEASFLYAQRLSLHTDNDVTWLDIDDFEQRLDAHVDALAVGDQKALNFLAEYEPTDAGEWFVITAVYCKLNHPKLFMLMFANIDFGDAEVMQAIIDALTQYTNNQWIAELSKLPFADKPEYLKVLLPVFDSRQIKTGAKAITIADEFLADTPVLIHACGNADVTAAPKILTTLLNYLDSDDVKVRDEASIALLKLEQLAPLKQNLGSLAPEKVNFEAMAIATDSSLFQFVNKLPPEQLTVNAIKALGLIGLPDVIPKLIQLFNDEEKASAIAEALFAITGAPLYEDVFIEDDVTEAELFPEELEAFKEGEVPKHLDDKPFGKNSKQISQNPELWMQWIQEFRQSFTVGKRHRLGVLISPQNLITVLQHPQCPHDIRKYTSFELQCRYDCDVPFSVTDTVHTQKQQLQQLQSWAQITEQQHAIEQGGWFVANRVVA